MPVSPSVNCAPPRGYIYLGVDVDSGVATGTPAQALRRWQDWQSLTGNNPAISFSDSYSVGWLPFYLQNIAGPRNAMSYIWWRPLTYSLMDRKIVPIDIKRLSEGTDIGGFSTDRMILENAMLCAMLNQFMLLAPAPDMNTSDNSWCAFNEDGTSRSHTTQDYINMFRRMVILTKGGTVTQINSTLAEYNLQPLDSSFVSPYLPSPQDPTSTYINASMVNFVFSATSNRGKPDIEANHWKSYYPGNEFVDWIGQSLYETSFDAIDDIDSFRSHFQHNKKPYILNWQLTKEDPFFVDSLMLWSQIKDDVRGLVYRNHPHNIDKYPNSLVRYKKKADDSRFLSTPYTNQELAPWGWIFKPSAGSTVNGMVGIGVRSYDDSLVSRVDYYIDGNFRFSDRIFPSTHWWNTTKESNGFHTIGIVVYDIYGNESTVYSTTYKVKN